MEPLSGHPGSDSAQPGLAPLASRSRTSSLPSPTQAKGAVSAPAVSNKLTLLASKECRCAQLREGSPVPTMHFKRVNWEAGVPGEFTLGGKADTRDTVDKNVPRMTEAGTKHPLRLPSPPPSQRLHLQ